jgi:ribosomal protein L12E/L44/L45/RPP1/RPP2
VRLPDGPYETAAGYVLQALGHLPSVGETVEIAGVRLTVTALDGRRIERLRVTLVAPPAAPSGDQQRKDGTDKPDKPEKEKAPTAKPRQSEPEETALQGGSGR